MGFARRIEAGGWLIGGEGGQLAVYATDGVREVVRAPSADVTFTHASGRFDDLLAAVGQRPGEPPTLWAMAARRWMKPMHLDGVAYVSSLLRLDDSRWVICGRLTQGTGFAAIYSPMQWETTYLLTRAHGPSWPARRRRTAVSAWSWAATALRCASKAKPRWCPSPTAHQI